MKQQPNYKLKLKQMKKRQMITLSAISLSFFLGLSSCGSHQNKSANVNDEPYTVSSGYSTDPDYRPTVSDDGDYHTIDGNRRQIQYQGSQEQQRDLDMIDEYMRNHPE